MEIKPPAPDLTQASPRRPRLGALALLLIALAILLLVTLVAWISLWGGGIESATGEKKSARAITRPVTIGCMCIGC